MGFIRNDAFNIKLQVAIQPNIGMDSDARHSVVEILNHTAADEAVLSMKTRAALWNVHGAGFYDRHTLFDLQYNQLNDISSEIAERARVLGGLPISSFEEFLKNTRLIEQPGDVPDMLDLLADHEATIRSLRQDAKKCSEEYEDEVTHGILVGILSLHEKMAWRLRTYFEFETAHSESPGNQ